ncbi:hypothetical protein L198_08049 [Cryptococcus wingfieldii CBS 7118]|uniref:Uncharacterized protein n=1 Tax=Cryptococcus wingfieldii CBS 7118 TaxID=1295528 RepID=A0A1E3HLV8_9TREE|nr:hypothetical protein L198_08049 [Cryptococcus wingfieldii CBS 7118]ODN77314.1 hypothetical protein L198_08049 [Cryptococcus wingfieldii CBS 7118]
MSYRRDNETRSELLVTNILLDGSFPALSSTCAEGQGSNKDEPLLLRHVDPPLIETRFSIRSFRENARGRKVPVPVPTETEEAMMKYLDTVEASIKSLDKYAEPSKIQWGDSAAAFREETHRVYTRQQNLLRNTMDAVYIEENKRPFTYRVHSTVDEFVDDGGELLGRNDQSMDWTEYEERLERAVTSAQGVDAICAASSPDVLDMVFTTEVIQPTTLLAKTGEGETMEWRVLDPKATVACLLIKDDFPETFGNAPEAYESYCQSIFEAMENVYLRPGTNLELGPATTAEDFVQDTRRYEQSLVRQAAFASADLMSATGRSQQTDVVLPREKGKTNDDDAAQDSQAVNGRRVKVAWVDSSMFDVLTGQPSKEPHYYFNRISKYESSIEEGLDRMRKALGDKGEEENDVMVLPERTVWGTWK